MRRHRLGHSDLMVSPLAFGGNVFGWTADKSMSFRLLDHFVEAGFNLVDTADVYSRWIPGHQGGESENIIGEWLKKSKKRQSVIIATKVGFEMKEGETGHSDKRNLKKSYIFKAIENSLRRLQIDCIDLYQTHIDDLDTPVEETMEALNILIKQGKVRALGASQYSPERLIESQNFAKKNNLIGYCCLQPGYNLCMRENYERHLQPVVHELGLGVITYFSLAAGFLTGKYRSEQDLSKSPRGQGIVKSEFLNEKGLKILKTLDRVSESLNAPMSTVALAWILSNPTITAPIASATNLNQLDEILRAVDLVLDKTFLKLLNEASAF